MIYALNVILWRFCIMLLFSVKVSCLLCRYINYCFIQFTVEKFGLLDIVGALCLLAYMSSRQLRKCTKFHIRASHQNGASIRNCIISTLSTRPYLSNLTIHFRPPGFPVLILNCFLMPSIYRKFLPQQWFLNVPLGVFHVYLFSRREISWLGKVFLKGVNIVLAPGQWTLIPYKPQTLKPNIFKLMYWINIGLNTKIQCLS